MSPPARAKRIRISVRETTPTKRPEMRAPGSADAEIEGPLGAMKGGLGDVSSCGFGVCDEEKGSDCGAEVPRGGVRAGTPEDACDRVDE